jgi:predicted HD superfamily hydrolase involved in NAD metabolism
MDRWAALTSALAQQISGERLAHTYRVVETARELSRRFGAPEQQAAEAALMHDYAKAMPAGVLLAEARRHGLIVDPAEELQPYLLHGPVAAALLAEQGLITDPAVLDAIRWHTTGRAGMSLLEKVIWLADYIEPGRRFPGVDAIREMARDDLDRALLMALDGTITYVVQQGWLLHLYTVHARNWLLAQRSARR